MSHIPRYEILESLPAYGPMYVSISENNETFYSEGFVVRFYVSENASWVGNFEPGLTGLNAVYEFVHNLYVLVIAGGTCYLMNPDFQKPISIFGSGYETVIKTLDGRVILQDSTHLTIFESSGEYWSSRRISLDGIRELTIEGNLVRGIAYEPTAESEEWVEFVLDLEQRIVARGSIFQTEIERVKKPWWKLW